MIREFTETVGRFGKGQRFDYPLATWHALAESAGKPLDKFTAEVELATGSNSTTRIFTRAVGRYPRGHKATYPPDTWARLAADAKMKLEEFTSPEN